VVIKKDKTPEPPGRNHNSKEKQNLSEDSPVNSWWIERKGGGKGSAARKRTDRSAHEKPNNNRNGDGKEKGFCLEGGWPHRSLVWIRTADLSDFRSSAMTWEEGPEKGSPKFWGGGDRYAILSWVVCVCLY